MRSTFFWISGVAVLRFAVVVFEIRGNLAEPDLGAGLDDKSPAVVHRRGISYGFAVDAHASSGTWSYDAAVS